MQQYNYHLKENITPAQIKEFLLSPINLLIFDFDGVLVDTQVVANEIQFNYINKLQSLDLSLHEFGEKFSGMQVKTILEIIQKEKDNIGSMPINKIVQDIDNLVLQKLASQSISPLPGVVDFLSSSSMKRCIGSNCSLRLLKPFLKSSNLEKYFNSYVFSADMVTNPKPSPDLYLYAARYMGVNVEECLVIEDSIVGIQAAISAGMQVVGILAGSHTSSTDSNKLINNGAKAVFYDMRDLTNYLSTIK
jgi:phosphoglycolate phosphatase